MSDDNDDTGQERQGSQGGLTLGDLEEEDATQTNANATGEEGEGGSTGGGQGGNQGNRPANHSEIMGLHSAISSNIAYALQTNAGTNQPWVPSLELMLKIEEFATKIQLALETNTAIDKEYLNKYSTFCNHIHSQIQSAITRQPANAASIATLTKLGALKTTINTRLTQATSSAATNTNTNTNIATPVPPATASNPTSDKIENQVANPEKKNEFTVEEPNIFGQYITIGQVLMEMGKLLIFGMVWHGLIVRPMAVISSFVTGNLAAIGGGVAKVVAFALSRVPGFKRFSTAINDQVANKLLGYANSTDCTLMFFGHLATGNWQYLGNDLKSNIVANALYLFMPMHVRNALKVGFNALGMAAVFPFSAVGTLITTFGGPKWLSDGPNNAMAALSINVLDGLQNIVMNPFLGLMPSRLSEGPTRMMKGYYWDYKHSLAKLVLNTDDEGIAEGRTKLNANGATVAGVYTGTAKGVFRILQLSSIPFGLIAGGLSLFPRFVRFLGGGVGKMPQFDKVISGMDNLTGATIPDAFRRLGGYAGKYPLGSGSAGTNVPPPAQEDAAPIAPVLSTVAQRVPTGSAANAGLSTNSNTNTNPESGAKGALSVAPLGQPAVNMSLATNPLFSDETKRRASSLSLSDQGELPPRLSYAGGPRRLFAVASNMMKGAALPFSFLTSRSDHRVEHQGSENNPNPVQPS